jgi:hypothetical protein
MLQAISQIGFVGRGFNRDIKKPIKKWALASEA